MVLTYVFPPHATPALPVSGSDQKFPVHRIYCVGRNYAAHSREMGGNPEREAPFFFSKPADALITRGEVPYPGQTHELHHEVELVVALQSGSFNLSEAEALPCIYGYAVGVDLTRRDLQAAAKNKGRPWDVAKGFDDSAPVSAICPAARCGHPGSASIQLSVNGALRQSADISDMIWSASEIIVELSCFYHLQRGDLIFTGTPAGVASLHYGDHIACRIDGIGALDFRLTGSP